MTYCKQFIQLTTSTLCLIALAACASTKSLTRMSQNEAVTLRYKPKVSSRQVTNYATVSHTKTFEDQQIISEQIEGVDFAVESTVKSIDYKKNHIKVNVKTLSKQGNVSLHELAFPQVDETIPFTYDSLYRVVSVKGWANNSIFYVPPMSFPKKKVKVGDTWALTKDWLGQKNGIPLKIDIVTILKTFYQCPGKRTCVDLEISGNVSLNAKITGLSRFTSRINGRALIRIDDGSVLWSKINSEEKLLTEDKSLIIKSCIASLMKDSGLKNVTLDCKMQNDLHVELLK